MRRNITLRPQWTVTSPTTSWNNKWLPNAMTVAKVLAGVEVHLLSIVKHNYNTGIALLMSTYSALFFFLSAAFGEFRVLASREGDSFQSKPSWVWVMRHCLISLIAGTDIPNRARCSCTVGWKSLLLSKAHLSIILAFAVLFLEHLIRLLLRD
ncbi:hypothetical protein EDB87DRAFT_1637700 [Lactarius vividus]|nr:hypothetical protein EDB87DRAFT_1637700 [Lactarius vividus]